MCREVFAEPPTVDMPTGSGLFVTLLGLADGRLAAVYYDRNRTALVVASESAPGSSQFAETVLDETGDRGMWASAVADGTMIHVAYQDALVDAVYYTSWNGTVTAPQLVDDGARNNDRTHPVGASATIVLRGGVPTIVYQDGMTADLMLAQRSNMTWSVSAVAPGLPLDGFHVAGAGATLVWGALDHTTDPIMTLKSQLLP